MHFNMVLQLKIIFLISQPKHVVGTQEKGLNETVLLSTQKICLDCWARKIIVILCPEILLN